MVGRAVAQPISTPEPDDTFTLARIWTKHSGTVSPSALRYAGTQAVGQLPYQQSGNVEKDKVLIDCIAFMLIENNKILAEKRTLTTLLDPGAIAIPGGHIDSGETWEEALEREAREELAITLNSPRYVCSLLERLSDLYRIHYYVVESWSGQIECHEAEALLWIPLNELERFDLEVDKIAVNEYLRIYRE